MRLMFRSFKHKKRKVSIGQNNVLHVFINKSMITWSTESSVPFLSFSENLLQETYLFEKKFW